MNKIILFSALLFIFLASSVSAHAQSYRNVFILNDVFLNFEIISKQPQTRVNDSLIVHEGGRIDYLPDGKYILISGKSYYDWMSKSYDREMLSKAWNRAFGGDFYADVMQYYTERQTINISHELDLKSYWDKKKAEVAANK
ncbi:MAG TPA: hypothetical protein VJI52_01695 [Candidatus Nanoarchaeia archaeon]|nr:hypothetical protein [Candidatus Nanoarchaeia archaeon]